MSGTSEEQVGNDADGVVVIYEGNAPTEVAATVEGDDLWVEAEALRSATGWELKPEGICREDACIVIPPGRRYKLVRAERINLAGLAELRRQPAVHTDSGRAWAFPEPPAAALGRTDVEAPDFALPDLDGRIHALSDYRGRKVVLYAWSTWCGCRFHLPEWAALHRELEGEGLTVITLATDGGGADAAREWIEAAAPGHPSLIDEWHVTTELYGLVNVPNAVWIDEHGTIVRPPHAAGMTDVTHKVDRATFALSDRDIALDQRSRGDYHDGIRRWVESGSYALDPSRVRAERHGSSPATATAAAHHRLGKLLLADGEEAEALRHFRQAVELDPESWMLRRDAWGLRNSLLEGNAAMGPESPLLDEFWEAVDARGEEPFYPETKLD
jgi:peroxiredoxin